MLISRDQAKKKYKRIKWKSDKEGKLKKWRVSPLLTNPSPKSNP
jgi:hypothetical protein